MLTCLRCGQDNPDGFRFCGSCGAPLAAAPAREERKVVSVLFADLVGFTSRSEQLDPEDVRAMLSPYFARVREEIERHGGVVEKFIGDAVMALFGAPVAHEDDPERAVRAALAIRDAVREPGAPEAGLELQLRLGVNTGEALVALDARAAAGEGMASGDVVNTAARLQAAAPVNGILVGETTYRATRHAIDYREADPAEAKGKVDPVRAWEAVEARSRFGMDVETRAGTPLVGRERELGFLVDAFKRARSELSCQLITLVGVPGIGKSRLVSELFRVTDEDEELIFWRQGRSLPYGESMSFWALGEIAKAHAGILESDSTEEAAGKLHSMVELLLSEEAEREWVERHTGPLVGLSVGGDEASDRRGEAFTAWRRLIEAIADQSPLVLVFEDLHWADDGLLDFVDHLAEWASGVPLLLVCTARPELLDRRPGWGGGKLNSATASIPALTPEETMQLVAGLLDQTLLPAEVQSALLERAEGNPLYAEEYVRMLQDRGFLVRTPGGWQLDRAADLPLPESVQGMIAARLDALTPSQKELILDAAVVGKVFWPDALAAIGGRPDGELEGDLHALVRKELIRRERRSAIAGETQYAFLHLIARDVAYGQIPRAARVEKHRVAAEWIESLARDRSEDRAEMLAHHYLEALSLAEAAGIDAASLREPARVALTEATERALALNSWPSTVRFARAALDLGGDPLEQATAKLRLARAQWFIGEVDLETTDGARDGFSEHGQVELAAEAEILASDALSYRGDTDGSVARLDHAATLLAARPISISKARVFAVRAREAALAADPSGLERAEQALAMAEELESDELASHALNTRALMRADRGDRGALEDGERSAKLARAAKLPDHLLRALNNLANMSWTLARLDDASRYLRDARTECERYGLTQGLRWLDGEDMLDYELRGGWDEALAGTGAILSAAAESGYYLEVPARACRARIFLGRDDLTAALEETARALAAGREARHPQILGPALLWRGRALVESGSPSEAGALADEILATIPLWHHYMADLPHLLALLDRRADFLAAIEGIVATPWVEAGRLVGSGDFRGGAAAYDEIGVPAQAADARLLAAEALVAEGRRTEADADLRRALTFYRQVRATAYLKRGETLLAASA